MKTENGTDRKGSASQTKVPLKLGQGKILTYIGSFQRRPKLKRRQLSMLWSNVMPSQCLFVSL